MRAHGQTWDSRVVNGRSTAGLTWLQYLQQRLTAWRLQRKQALLIRQKAGWDAGHEQVRTPSAASALEYAADQGGPAMSMALYSAHTEMASVG
jgi:hypothetical protein